MSLPKPYYQDEWVTIYHGDCRDILPELPKVDLVLTDPPYNRGYFGEDAFAFNDLDLLKDSLRQGKLIYCFWTPKDMGMFEREFKERFEWLNTIICYFRNKTGFDSPYRWQKSYEPLFFGSNGKSDRRIVRDNIDACFDVWEATLPQTNFNGDSRSYHPTQKPLDIILKAIISSSDNGDLILDPFLGSGTTAYCAKKLNRKCIGIEIEEKYCEIAAKRCSQGVMRLEV